MMFNSGSRIPSELYRLIVGYIDDKRTLLSMLVSSRVAFADVERKLYHSIEFDHQNHRKHILFLESVLDANRPHLSGLIFRYCLIKRYGTGVIHHTLIKRALATFTNLKQLRFVIADVGEELMASVLPIEHPPFKLELFQWVILPKVHHDVGVMRFIASQPALKTLHVHNISAGLPQISLQNLQNLNDLAGSVGAILPLLPRSVPIDRLHWDITISQDLSHFPVLSGLRVLSILSFAPRPLLSAIFGRFKNVEVLALSSLHPDELPDLYRFPLHTLVFININRNRIANPIEEIFCNIKLLQHVFLPTPDGYLRWDRHAETAVPVSRDVIETNWWRYL